MRNWIDEKHKSLVEFCLNVRTFYHCCCLEEQCITSQLRTISDEYPRTSYGEASSAEHAPKKSLQATYCVISSHTSYSILVPSSPYKIRFYFDFTNCTAAHATVDSRGLKFRISSLARYVCLVPSTVLNSILVDSRLCVNYGNFIAAQCESLWGNTFGTSTPRTAFKSSPNTVLASKLVLAGISLEGVSAGDALLQWPPNQHLSDYPIGIITSGENHNIGHLGLESTP